MKRNILMAALFAGLFATASFAQAVPATKKAENTAKIEKKKDKENIALAKKEDKQLAKADRKAKRMAHRNAKHHKAS